MDYKYEFPADELTLRAIEKLSESEWRNIFELILNNKSIDYDIDFPDLTPLGRLKQVFDFISTFRLNKQQVFQLVLVAILAEEFEKGIDPELNYILIQLVDYVRPYKYYGTLEGLVTTIGVRDYFIGPDGYNLHFHLVNAIIVLDLNRNLYSFLRSLSGREPLPEFFQISIRYIFMQLDQKSFDDFMQLNFKAIGRPEICKTVLQIFDEYAFYKRSFILIFDWLLKYSDNLKSRYAGEFQYFIKELQSYLVNLHAANQDWLAFYPLLYLVKSYLPNFVMISKYFTVLQEQSEILLPAKAELFFRLGQMDGIIISKDGICFSDNVTILFTEDTNYIRRFMTGYKIVNAPFYRRISADSLTI